MAYNYPNPPRQYPDQPPPGRGPPPQQGFNPRPADYSPQQGAGYPSTQPRPRQNTISSDDGYYGNGFLEDYGVNGYSPPHQENRPDLRMGNFSRPQPGPPNQHGDRMRGPPPDNFGARGPGRQGFQDRPGPPNGYGPAQDRRLNGPHGPASPYGSQSGRPGPNFYGNGQQRSPPLRDSKFIAIAD
jgi:hypothetical protein